MNTTKFVIKAGKLIDGTGAEPIDRGMVYIEGERIQAVGQEGGFGTPEDAMVIDLTGHTVLAGMVDAHVHFVTPASVDPFRAALEPQERILIRAVGDVSLLLRKGFTTVRDVGGLFGPYLRDAVEAKEIVGPRIRAARLIITQTAGHADTHFLPLPFLKENPVMGRLADGPDECRRAAREQLREGADLLKICSSGGVISQRDLRGAAQLTIEEIRAVTEEAHRAGVKVASHALGAAGIRNAIAGDVDSIEHGDEIDEEMSELMAERGIFLVPTFSVLYKILERADSGVPSWAVLKAEEALDKRKENFSKACAAGVKVCLGADFGWGAAAPHGDNAIELSQLVEGGLSTMDALLAGTRNGAELLGMDHEIGTLEPGKLADLIAVPGSPLSDISLMQQVDFVMKGGSIVKDGSAVSV